MTMQLKKMSHEKGEVLQYYLGEKHLNPLLGKEITVRHSGRITCVNCQREIKKTYGDGYCYPCFSTLARTDSCIIKPHTCHFHLGTCRESEWGKAHCFIEHVVYLALTSDVKVGVTGAHKLMERWGDQGAVQALVIARTPDRRTAGLIEKGLANHMPDRTNWRKLVTSEPEPVDLEAAAGRACEMVAKKMRQYLIAEREPVRLAYPVLNYPAKARSVNLAKEKEVSGILEGIRGQYLFVSGRAINIRRHSGFEVELQAAG